MDLDALIGDLRREAARRRAAPDFPIDEEARLTVAGERLGPTGAGMDLDAVLSGLDALAALPPPDGRTRVSVARRPRPAPAEVSRIAELAGSAVRGLAARVADLERRMDRELRRPLVPPGEPADAPDLHHWIDPTLAITTGSAGRVLIAGAKAGEWLARLTEGGVDAYGIDPTLAEFSDDGPLRSGEVAAHLDSVGGGELGVAVLLRPPGPARPEDLAASLARAAARVAVVSEAPWWWYRRVGPPECDVSPGRPVLAETWMALLGDAGYRVTAEYGPGGRDYLVRGERDR